MFFWVVWGLGFGNCNDETPASNKPRENERIGHFAATTLGGEIASHHFAQLVHYQRWHRCSYHRHGRFRQPEKLLEVHPVLRDRIPVIKRLSGGGTVIIDSDTVFVTLICNRGSIPNLQLFPRPIMSWTEQLYAPVFKGVAETGVADFHLLEHDYVLGDRKFGGNAQSITKDRWLHHTSFLWDYKVENMAYLKLPARAPKYRLERHHNDFICSLKDYSLSRPNFLDNIVSALAAHFSLQTVKIDDSDLLPSGNYPHMTRILTENELKEQR